MNKKTSGKLIAVLLAVVLSTSLFLFAGCSLVSINADGIHFKVDNLTLELGSEKDINSSIVEVTPQKAENRKYSLSGGVDSVGNRIFDVVSSTNRIIARGVGTADLIATSDYGNFTDKIPVTVTYAKVNELLLNYNGDFVTAQDTIILPYTNSTATPPISFTSSVSPKDCCDPENQVNWLYNNGQADSDEIVKKVGESYSFSPQETGEYSVKVSMQSDGKTFTDWQNVNVCSSIDATLAVSGALLQEKDGYSRVQFSLDYTNPIENPQEIIEWFVNDVVAHTGDKTFIFLPKVAGAYKISAKINGKIVPLSNGDTEATLIAKGTITPSNIRVDYDNCYPKFIVRWDEIQSDVGYSVKIINNSTAREVSDNLNTNNPEAKGFFTSSSFDATSFLDASIFETSFTVSVKTLADKDGIFTDSDFSNEATSQKLNIAAKPYLEKKYLDDNKNHFIADFDNEFLDWFCYSMLFRGGAGTSSNVKLYINFSFTDADALINEAFKYTSFTGEFSWQASSSGKVVSYKLIFNTDVTPSKRTSHSAISQGWNSVRPHVNSDASKARPASTMLKIESLPKVKVETSEQLYYIAEKGYCPDPKIGSRADEYYKYARKILCFIITDDMTDTQKAHAIYDWILWRVNYDKDVLAISELSESVKYAAYYLEGVLTDSDYFAVCDGMSKAYSLMCNMEGIPCLRITGEVEGGGHAWNKVKINGNWYVVDCTWGDMAIENNLEKTTAPKEFASHAYFLLSDFEIADHKQDPSKNYPIAPRSYNFLDVDIEYGDTTIDFYINRSATVSMLFSETKTLVNYMLDQAAVAPNSYSVGPDGTNPNNISFTDYIAFEIKVNRFVSGYFTDISVDTNPLLNAFNSCGKVLNKDYSVSYHSMMGSTYLFIFIKC